MTRKCWETMYPSVYCLGRGDSITREGTLYPRVNCPWGTIYPRLCCPGGQYLRGQYILRHRNCKLPKGEISQEPGTSTLLAAKRDRAFI